MTVSEGRKIVGDVRSEGERQVDDFYKTCSFGIRALMEKETIYGRVLEPACGDGAMSKVLNKSEEVDEVVSLDIVDRGYGRVQDYFEFEPDENFDCVVTNPPYKKALEFVKKSLKDVNQNGKVCMLLKLVFLESEKRYEFFQENPPSRIYVFSKRLDIWKNGNKGENSGLVCYAWFVWDMTEYTLKPTVDWICEGREGMKNKRMEAFTE